MAKALEKAGAEVSAYQGRIVEVIVQPMRSGDTVLQFERAQRSPGVRLIAQNDTGHILLTKEWRYELEDYDYRLPGGKVADELRVWHELEASGMLDEAAKAKVIAEAKEEAGLIVEPEDVRLIEIVPDGTTVRWDLYYFEAKKFVESEQALERGEDISTGWYSPAEILALMQTKKIREGRSVYILMPYVLN